MNIRQVKGTYKNLNLILCSVIFRKNLFIRQSFKSNQLTKNNYQDNFYFLFFTQPEGIFLAGISLF
jgi:hypothetical protein